MSGRARAEESLNAYHFPWQEHRLSPAVELLLERRFPDRYFSPSRSVLLATGAEEIPDLEAYLRKRFGVDVVAYPPFQRVRYDINVESLATGHVYGIFFDHSRLVDDPAVAMAQCELEYLRTRSVLAVDPEVIWAELEQIAQWLEGFLGRHGIKTRRGVYSKLSFLRDHAGAVS